MLAISILKSSVIHCANSIKLKPSIRQNDKYFPNTSERPCYIEGMPEDIVKAVQAIQEKLINDNPRRGKIPITYCKPKLSFATDGLLKFLLKALHFIWK